MKTLPTALALSLTASAAFASGPGEAKVDGPSYLENGVLTYEVFEHSVAHVDIASCPAEFDPDEVFCRLALANEQANVFVFALEGEQPLMAVKHYALDDGFLPF